MKETLIGTVLGDGYLEPHGRGVRLQVNHSERFKAYVEWKRREFLELAPSPLHRHDNGGYPFWRFVTRSHPYLENCEGSSTLETAKWFPRRSEDC